MAVLKDLKPNVGVFTDPAHNLWVADAEPQAESLQDEKALKEGDALIGIRSTGICGYAVAGEAIAAADLEPDQTFISGMLGGWAP